MQKRPKPLTIPDRYPFLLVELPDREAHNMRIPSPLAIAKLFQRIDKIHTAALVAVKGGVEPTTLLKEIGPEALSIMGALIGKGWHHADWHLNATDGDQADLMAFGERVYEELHDDGYTLEQILCLGLTVMRASWDHTRLTDEVTQRAAFFFPAMAQTTSSGSTVASNTSATPGA